MTYLLVSQLTGVPAFTLVDQDRQVHADRRASPAGPHKGRANFGEEREGGDAGRGSTRIDA
jgi:hypothetical protein